MSNKLFTSDFTGVLAIVCHDAGATNLILPWLRACSENKLHVIMQGPAKQLWESAYPNISIFNNLHRALKGADKILTGTGWESNIEHDARQYAQENGIYSIAVIDHWVNYKERFTRDDKIILPEELWVVDEYALHEAKKIFPQKKIKLRPNIYLKEQVNFIKKCKRLSPLEILYVCEPIRNNWRREIEGEFQALEFFINNLHKLNLPKDSSIRLRPHPSDPPGKYDDWIGKNHHLKIFLDDNLTLGESIGRATWVVGCESFALVLALESDRKVISSLPPWAPQCRLPQKDIMHLKDIN